MADKVIDKVKKIKEKQNKVVDERHPKWKKEKVYDPLEVITEKYDDLPEDVIQIRKSEGDYKIITKDPHGYSYIEGPKLPDHLKGAFTTYMLADQALKNWIKGK